MNHNSTFHNSNYYSKIENFTNGGFYVGKKDISVKAWFKDNRRFADLFNGVCFEGKQVIKPDELIELEGESDLVLQDKNGKRKYVQRYRDIVKGWNGVLLRSVLALEYQDKVHYAMPVKNMVMDALAYTDQIENTWSNISSDEKKSLLGTPEHFSKFRKSDTLIPVITLVFYCGEEWDGAMDLHSMFKVTESGNHNDIIGLLRKYVPNYHINLFNPLNKNEFSTFLTDLQMIFGMLKYRYDKKGLHQYTQDNQAYFSSVDYDTCNVITTLLNTDKIFKDVLEIKKEGNDMCKALDDLYNDGIKLGIEQGIEQGIERGIERGIIETIIKLVSQGKLTLEDGACELGISTEELKAKMA